MVTVPSKDGTNIASWRSGTGPALVLVHGTTVDHTAWDGVRPELEPSFTVYAMDRRGRGGSGDAPTFAVEREVEDVAAVVDSIDGAVHVMGHSYGAIPALEAARLTSKIASLVLYDPPMIGFGPDELPAGILEELEALVAQDRRDEAVGWIFQRMQGRSPGEVEEMRADPTWASRVASVHTVPRELRAGGVEYRFAWSGFEEMRQPTLLLQGELSPARLRASVAALHALLPTSRVVVLQGQGHAGLRTAPDLVAAEVLTFLRSNVD
jgi:pimeloyl-ACP methyl ester carboxylesterase